MPVLTSYDIWWNLGLLNYFQFKLTHNDSMSNNAHCASASSILEIENEKNDVMISCHTQMTIKQGKWHYAIKVNQVNA